MRGGPGGSAAPLRLGRGGAMPWRDWDREQVWLMPPSLDEVLADDHPARLVAALVDSLTTAEWAELGVDLAGQPLGAPAYHPRALLGIWLYGFMTGLRSSRRLETACREQLALQWLSGFQQPDHNTLWRFYREHRNQLRGLLRHTVQIAARLGLVDWALQAVDGTKVAGSASSSRTYDAQQLERLLERTERAIADLEAQNEAGDEPAAPRLPADLAEAQRLRADVLAARQALAAGERRHVNLTDPDARLLRAAGGYLTGYNAQAMAVTVRYEAGAAGPLADAVSAGHDGDAGGGQNIGDEDRADRSSKGEDVGNEGGEGVGSEGEGGEGVGSEGEGGEDEGGQEPCDQEPGEDRGGDGGEAGGADEAGTRSGGLLITAADVTQDPTDQAQLLPMIEAAEQSGGVAAGLTLADAGYFSAANLAACSARATPVAIPEARCPTAHPYHHSRFAYDPGADCYQCPEGQLLRFQRLKHRRRRASVRVYAAAAADCLACPAFGRCTTSQRGRRIEVSLHADALTAHRRWMQAAAARDAFRRRKQLIEPVFGIIKEQQAGRRFLLRGLEAVRSEWTLLAVAFNLRTLAKALSGKSSSGKSISRARYAPAG